MKDDTVQDLLLRAYQQMLWQHRGEYVYKNELINRYLLPRAEAGASTVLSEFLIAGSNSRADLVHLGESATAFEIKSERDDKTRLSEQLRHASAVFDQVYVVCSPRHADNIEKSLPEYTGLIILEPGVGLNIERKAIRQISTIEPDTIFLSLRKSDYETIISRRFGSLPGKQAGDYWKLCRALFSSLSKADAYEAFLEVLRHRFVSGLDQVAVEALPSALSHLYFNIGARKRSTLLGASVLRRQLLLDI